MSSPKPRIRLIEVLVTVIVLAVVSGWFSGLLPMHRESARMTGCYANLRTQLHAMYIYSADGDLFPSIFDKSRAGEMALFNYRYRQPLSTEIPSPTADLWKLVLIYDQRFFVCPSSTDTPDPVKDATTVFDFAGPDHLSYAYVYQYHPQRQPLGTASNPLLPVIADASPYIKGSVEADVATDRKSVSRGNSRNHRGRHGQNIAYVDGHVQFERTPKIRSQAPQYGYPGFQADNIYTTRADGEPGDPGRAPTATRIQIGSKYDYCLVP